MTTTLRRSARLGRIGLTGLTCVAAAAALAASTASPAQRDNKSSGDDDSRRPKLTLRAQPTVSISPARVVLTAELVGGANDFQDFYCPTVVWEWGDGTESESTFDCEPYQAGKSEIKRRFTVEHVFRAGDRKVIFRLKRNDKSLAMASVTLKIQQGVQENH